MIKMSHRNTSRRRVVPNARFEYSYGSGFGDPTSNTQFPYIQQFGGNWSTSLPVVDFVASLLQGAEHSFSDIDADIFFGFPSNRSPGIDQFEGFHIQTFPYREHYDRVYPSNLLTSLVIYMQRPSFPESRLKRDKMVRHFNMTGYLRRKLNYTRVPSVLTTRIVNGYVFPYYDTVWGAPFSARSTSRSLVIGSFPAGTGTSSFDEFADYESWVCPTAPLIPLCESIRKIVGNNIPIYILPNPNTSRNLVITKFEYVFDDKKVRIDYEYELTETHIPTGTRTYGKWRISTALWMTPTGLTQSEIPNVAHRPVAYHMHQDYQFQLMSGFWDIHAGFYGWPVGYFPYPEGNLVSSNYPYDMNNRYGPFMGSTISSSYSIEYDDLVKIIRDEADSHGRFFYDMHEELVKSSVYSFQNALEAFLINLKNNYLEVLKELPELPELIPDVKLLIQSLTDISRLNLRGLVRLGSFISSTHLKYSFGIAPNLQVVEELNRYESKLYSLFDEGLKAKTYLLRGSFFYPFLEKESGPWTGSELTTRTLASVTTVSNPFFKALTDLYGVGISPTLQNIWEILPGSFVVDWFTNMSARYKAIDLQLISFAVRCNWFEHSYTVSSPLKSTSGILPHMGNPSSQLQHKYYARDLSLARPCIVNGPIDFLRVRSSPSLGIVGSLLYQILVK